MTSDDFAAALIDLQDAKLPLLLYVARTEFRLTCVCPAAEWAGVSHIRRHCCKRL